MAGSAIVPARLVSQMRKENLVLVHSFPTNSILLRGLVDFLEDHFAVHFVDLPGFTRACKPLPRPSIDAYASFLSSHVRDLDLDSYLLGGISFGYLVVSQTSVDQRCRAILAMEPFLGVRSLHMRSTARLMAAFVTRSIVTLGQSQRVFHSNRWRQRLLRRGQPEERVETVLREIDPRTFFATAYALVTYQRPLSFHNLPHVLMVNPEDRTINAEDVTEVFQSRVRDLLVVKTTVDHYPTDLTKAYFEERISAQQVASIFEFLNRLDPQYPNKK